MSPTAKKAELEVEDDDCPLASLAKRKSPAAPKSRTKPKDDKNVKEEDDEDLDEPISKMKLKKTNNKTKKKTVVTTKASASSSSQLSKKRKVKDESSDEEDDDDDFVIGEKVKKKSTSPKVVSEQKKKTVVTTKASASSQSSKKRKDKDESSDEDDDDDFVIGARNSKKKQTTQAPQGAFDFGQLRYFLEGQRAIDLAAYQQHTAEIIARVVAERDTYWTGVLETRDREIREHMDAQTRFNRELLTAWMTQFSHWPANSPPQ